MSWKDKIKDTNITMLSAVKIKGFEIEETFTVGEKITNHTQFQAASISKAVFAVGLLRLIEERSLSLDVDIAEYCKMFKLLKLDGDPAKATLRQLLSHTAGLNVHGFLGYTDPENLPTTLQIINGELPSNSEKVMQVNAPGQHWKYSGGGYMLLQQMVEEMTGMDLPRFMDAYVLQPLKMSDSTYKQLPEEHISGYASMDPASSYGYYFMPEHAAAGLWTTPSDLAKFGIHIQKILAGEKGLINCQFAQEMITAQCADVFNHEGRRNCQMGLGVFLKSINGKKFFGHSGGNVGFISVMNFSVEDGCGACIMVNDDSVGAIKFMLEMQRKLLEENNT